jgi:hypothetical protein
MVVVENNLSKFHYDYMMILPNITTVLLVFLVLVISISERDTDLISNAQREGPFIVGQIPESDVPVAVSGNNIYIAWINNTSHNISVFFTKSTDGGKTFAKTMVINPPNKDKTFVIRRNVSIGAYGNNVAVTWWTNETGALNPVIRISNDAGNTFRNILRLNSTAGGTNNQCAYQPLPNMEVLRSCPSP